MSYLALYREWRPKNFDEVVEQKQAVYALRQAVINNQIAHAYLFSGTRGTGKTTLAKIFSRAINCLNPQDGNPCNECQICKGILDGSLMDVVEMDAASNNSVDNIRRICDEVVFMPSLAKYKVYIVDEVHMLSTGAFNALLKTLEEPPAHAVFILATTEPHRLPATILSRCQRYDFRRIPLEGITARLREISAADKIQLTDEALEAIASFADGAMRDAISLLDQARASIPGKIERNDVLALAGITQDDFMMEMSEAVLEGKISTILRGIDELVMSGRDLSRFVTDLAQFFRNLLICQVSNQPERLIQATDQTISGMKQLSAQTGYKHLINLIQALSELNSDLKWSSDTRTALEVGLIRIISENDNIALEDSVIEQPSVNKLSPEPIKTVEQPSIQEKITEPEVIQTKEPTGAEPTGAEPTVTAAAAIEPEDYYPDFSDDDAPPVSDDDYLDATISDPQSKSSENNNNSAAELERQVDLPSVSLNESSTEGKKEVNNRIDNKGENNINTEDISDLSIDIDVKKVWQQALDKLQLSGEMILYLFGKKASVQLCGQVFNVIFGKDDQAPYEEFSKAQSQKSLLMALRDLTGQEELKLTIRIEEDPEQAAAAGCVTAEEPWIRKIRETADQFGIPMKMED
ncbi:MAG: polymerase subunit gamma/tau [Clostridiales bacterium]|jgi:DNA polymerase-3 subunit gamma/tau|nr:polymerase subunit gamma/tau [Clostridiales bacterium]